VVAVYTTGRGGVDLDGDSLFFLLRHCCAQDGTLRGHRGGNRALHEVGKLLIQRLGLLLQHLPELLLLLRDALQHRLLLHQRADDLLHGVVLQVLERHAPERLGLLRRGTTCFGGSARPDQADGGVQDLLPERALAPGMLHRRRRGKLLAAGSRLAATVHSQACWQRHGLAGLTRASLCREA